MILPYVLERSAATFPRPLWNKTCLNFKMLISTPRAWQPAKYASVKPDVVMQGS